MKNRINLNTSLLEGFIEKEELKNIEQLTRTANNELRNKSGVGSEYTDWLNLPSETSQNLLDDIKNTANKINSNSKYLVVIGIGGSYLGSKAVTDIFPNTSKTKLLFTGNSLSSNQIQNIIKEIGDDDFSINVISKSGTTTEPAIAFRIFKDLLIKKYGEKESKDRIIATTDANKGALHDEALKEGWKSFEVPDGVGGRFSVLTPVGLLPIAVHGTDIDKLISGAKEASIYYDNDEIDSNDVLKYASYRNILYSKGYTTEILVNYQPELQYFGEWWKQLMGESEGKNLRGIYPSSVNFTTDLHSLGQYIQEGRRNIFETVINLKVPNQDIKVPASDDNSDGLQYIENKSLNEINSLAISGVGFAHYDGGVPNIQVEIDEQSEENIGYLIYFFELSVAISGYLLAVNPFNQPGVEAYKKNMFALLGKPGYEELTNKLKNRMK